MKNEAISMVDVLEHHNVKSVTGGELIDKPLKSKLQKILQRHSALSFKAGGKCAENIGGVAKGKRFELACTECALKMAKELEEELKKII